MAVTNALKLAASLFVTLGVAAAIQLWLPRFFGPERFGGLHFAQELAFLVFCLSTLGVEVYLQREVAQRPAHATEVFGGVMAIRLLWCAALYGVMVAALWAMGRLDQVLLASLFAAGQVLMMLNTTQRALLHAARTVDEVAIVNSVGKVVWGAGVVVGVLLGGGLLAVPISLCVSEGVKCVALQWACRRHLGLRLVFDWGAARRALWLSLPFFVNDIAHQIYGKVDVSMIAAFTEDREVGFYGAAVNVTLFALLVVPAINAVVLPMIARIGASSPDELRRVMGEACRWALILTTPVAAWLVINAGDFMTLLYEGAYDASVPALQLLAGLTPLTYLTILFSNYLFQLGSEWAVARTSLVGLVLNPVLNLVLIPRCAARFGDGGAGIGAAIASVTAECVALALLYAALRGQVAGRVLAAIGWRLAVTVAAMAAVHRGLLPPGLGAWRSAIDIVVYILVGLITGALPLGQMAQLARGVIARRRGESA